MNKSEKLISRMQSICCLMQRCKASRKRTRMQAVLHCGALYHAELCCSVENCTLVH